MEYARKLNVPFMIHQDSNVGAFTEQYKNFNYLVSFDVGCDTDVERFRRAFSDITLNIFIYTSVLHEKTESELFDFIVETASKSGPLDKIGFSVYDIDLNVPDDKINGICKAYAYLKEKK